MIDNLSRPGEPVTEGDKIREWVKPPENIDGELVGGTFIEKIYHEIVLPPEPIARETLEDSVIAILPNGAQIILKGWPAK